MGTQDRGVHGVPCTVIIILIVLLHMCVGTANNTLIYLVALSTVPYYLNCTSTLNYAGPFAHTNFHDEITEGTKEWRKWSTFFIPLFLL